MFRGTNPVLNADRFDNQSYSMLGSQPMTVSGTVNKAMILFLILAVSASAMVYQAYMGYVDKLGVTTIAGAIIGLILALIISFKPNTASYLSPFYAFAQGAFMGGVTLMFEAQFPGIAIQAIGMTLVAMFVMLFLYKIGAIRATEKFKSTMMIALFSILGVYVLNIIMSLFGHPISFIVSSSPISIAVSGVIVVIASLMLIIDFDFIEKGSANLLPKQFEWYGAFGLMVTLIWLYIEILNLIAKSRNR